MYDRTEQPNGPGGGISSGAPFSAAKAPRLVDGRNVELRVKLITTDAAID
jgi:hypothetical protein